ncbi:hypothetical protein CsSME_00046111 [Camellia sinensis var. sinensis]
MLNFKLRFNFNDFEIAAGYALPRDKTEIKTVVVGTQCESIRRKIDRTWGKNSMAIGSSELGIFWISSSNLQSLVLVKIFAILGERLEKFMSYKAQN